MHIQTLQKNMFPVVITTALVLLYGFALFYTKHLEANVRARATELATETARETSLESLGGFLEELADDQKRLGGFFVSPDAAVSMIEEVENLGTIVGAQISIDGVQITDANTETGEGTMKMNINAEGTWREMMHLLALLDTFPLASRVDHVSFLVHDGKESGTSVWAFRVELSLTLRRP